MNLKPEMIALAEFSALVGASACRVRRVSSS